MQVSNQPITSTTRTEPSLDIRQGDLHKVTAHQEEGRVDGRGQVEAGRQATSQAPDVQQLLRNLGAGSNPSPELKEAAQILLDKGIPLTKETIQELRTFLERENGSIQQKLETIEALANRRLPITQTFLRPVHEALHGRELGQTLDELSRQIEAELARQRGTGGTGPDIRQIAAEVRQAVADARQMSAHQALLSQTVASQTAAGQGLANHVAEGQAEARELATRIIQLFLNAGAGAGQTQGQGQVGANAFAQIPDSSADVSGSNSTANQQPSAILKEAVQLIQREANFSRVLEQIQEHLLENRAFSREATTQVERALSEAINLHQQGRELAARGQLLQALTQAEQQLQSANTPSDLHGLEPRLGEQTQQHYVQNEQFQTSQALSTKDFIVSKVTKKLAEATQAFSELKREVSRGLDQVTRLVQQLKHHALPQVKQMLSTTIDKLDKAILKNELTMLTDMKTEKQLMQASSQLAEAKRLLGKGDFSAAQKMVQDVKMMLDKLRWQPSETRVQHFVLKETMHLEQQRPMQSVVAQVEESTRSLVNQEPSARHMFEVIRSLGLNHDSETARLLALQQGNTQHDGGERQSNLKAVLLQLLRAESEQGRSNVQAEQALHNLTGQQLLNKSDPGSSLQHLFLNIPFQLEDNLHNLRVMINGRKEGEKLDWENCSLYFLIETKKLGEIGILLSTTERNLSITIKNDSPSFKEKMEPLVEQCKENLKEIGYQVTGIHFTKLEAKQGQTQEQKKNGSDNVNIDPNKIPRTNVTTKGFDLKI